jgi:hypothetical protein
MVEENKDKSFGNTPTVQSDGVFRSVEVPDSELEFGQNYQARAKLTLSDGTEVFTNATTFTSQTALPEGFVPFTTTTTTTTTTPTPDSVPPPAPAGFVLPTTTTTTTTSTTTPTPIDFLDSGGAGIECPCGTIALPAGKKFDPQGMFIEVVGKKSSAVVTKSVSLLHSESAHVETQQVFTSVSESIQTSDFDEINSVTVVIDPNTQGPLLDHVISVKIKDFNTSEEYGNTILGLFGEKTSLYNPITKRSQVIVPLHGISLTTNFIVEFESLCDFYDPPCCDQLPEIAASGYKFLCLPLQDNFTFTLPAFDDIFTTTTTTTAHPPVQIRGITPD